MDEVENTNNELQINNHQPTYRITDLAQSERPRERLAICYDF